MWHSASQVDSETAERLAKGIEIHVWRLYVPEHTADFQLLLRGLTTDERNRAGEFRFPSDRRRFAIVRVNLRRLASLYLGVDEQFVDFTTRGATGKPCIHCPRVRLDLRFNVSHSDAVALYAFAVGAEVGIDVEKVQPASRVADIMDQVFSADELSDVGALAPDERSLALFNCWVRKEAFLKATGQGLSRSLHDLDVSWKRQAEPRIVATRPDPGEAKRWRLVGLSPYEGYVGALVYEMRQAAVRLFHLVPS